MEKMELAGLGVERLSEQEMAEIRGGGTSPAWWAILWDAVNHFGDIREGFTDGYHNTPPRY